MLNILYDFHWSKSCFFTAKAFHPTGVTLEVYNEMKRVATQNGSKTVTLLSTHKLVTARKVQGEPIPEANFSKLSLEKNETPFCDDSRS